LPVRSTDEDDRRGLDAVKADRFTSVDLHLTVFHERPAVTPAVADNPLGGHPARWRDNEDLSRSGYLELHNRVNIHEANKRDEDRRSGESADPQVPHDPP
jgi:hypothetical protein